ncbi:MAG TPA: endonuclease/exonuclease/phosphatase family protein [Leptolyngbyaceae cyanobacterium]
MRIVTWNVERPKLKSLKNKKRINYLLGLAPDLVILTETSLAVDLGSEFSGFFTQPSPRKPGPGEAVAAILVRNSRFKVLQQLETTDPREAICIEIESDLGRITVYGSIIPYHNYRGPEGKSVQWEEHKNAIAWHKQDWLNLRASFPQHEMITAGDYNQTRSGVGGYGTSGVRQLLSEALSVASLQCVTEEDFTATKKLSRHSIDHICLSPQLAAAVSEVDVWEGTLEGIRLSDHNGVIVDLGSSFLGG